MRKCCSRFAFFLLAVALVLCLTHESFAQTGTIAKRETADPNQTGYAKWVKITVKGAGGGSDALNDSFAGMKVLIDLNLDGDNDRTTSQNDVYEALGDNPGDIVTAPPGISGANDQYFYVLIKQGADHPYPAGENGYDTSIRPRVQLTNSGQLRVGTPPFQFSIANETDLIKADDGIKPLIRFAIYYDDGSGNTPASGGNPGNMTAFDGFVDRIDLIWSEPMRTSNVTVNNTIITGLGSTIIGLESLGTWNLTVSRFTLWVKSATPNTGISATLIYNSPAAASDRFREAATAQFQYYADSQSRGLTDRAGPALVSARTKRVSRRQPLLGTEGALQSKRILVEFSEPVVLVSVAGLDFLVKTRATYPLTNDISAVISPTPPTTSSAVYEFKLTTNFASENEVGWIQFKQDSSVQDVLGNYNGASSAGEPPTRPTPSAGPRVPIKDGILPIITSISTRDAAPTQMASGGDYGWGYLDWLDITFDHTMKTTKISSAGFAVSGTGIQTIGGTGIWDSNTMFRIPLAATNPKKANTGVIPVVSYSNPGGTNGLVQDFDPDSSYMGGLADDLLGTDVATRDAAGPAIIRAYTAGERRIRLVFSEKVNTTGWRINSSQATPPDKFKWFVGAIHYNISAPAIFFTGLSAARKDSVVYLNQTDGAWAKTDSGGVNFMNTSIVYDWASPANGNAQWDNDVSLDNVNPVDRVQGSDVRVKRDNIAPILTACETADLDSDGKIDHYRFSFDDLSPIFPKYSFNPANWSITGYDGLKTGIIPDLYETNAFGDTVVAYIRFNETTGSGPEVTPYNGDTGDVPDVVVGAGRGFSDWADNFMAALPVGITVEKDKAGPAIMNGVKTTSTTTIDIPLSEDIKESSLDREDFILDMGLGIFPIVNRVERTGPGMLKLTAHEIAEWLPEHTGTIRFTSVGVIFDNIDGADNGNTQTYEMPVNDGAANHFDVNLVVPGNQVIGEPFLIEVVARSSHNEVDENFNERINFSSNLSQNHIDLPDGSQALTNGYGYFYVVSWVVTDSLKLTVTKDSDSRYSGTSDPINIVEATIDAPDTLIVKDYKGADGTGDQGGYVSLIFDFSDNHPGIGNDHLIDYYQLYREVDGDIYHWGTVPATDPTEVGADSMRVVVWTGDNDSSMFFVQSVWLVDGGPLASRRDDDQSPSIKNNVLMVRPTNPVLIRRMGESHYDPNVQSVEEETQIVSSSVMGKGRSKDDIAPKAIQHLSLEKDGVAVRAKWSPVELGVNDTPELFPVLYVVYSHPTNAYFDPLTEGTEVATTSDTTLLLNGEELRKFFAVLAKDSDNYSDVSHRGGKYGFDLVKATTPIYNYLSLPLANDLFSNADDVAKDVGGLDVVYKLDHNTNAYTIFWLPQINYGTNFEARLGLPVLVSAGASAPENWFYVGSVPEQAAVTCALHVPEDGSAYNEIIVPLDKTEITTADKLASDIGGVEVVLKLDPQSNGFSTFWLPGINYGENFAIQPGEPVLISVNREAPSVWPNYSLMSEKVPVISTEPVEEK